MTERKWRGTEGDGGGRRDGGTVVGVGGGFYSYLSAAFHLPLGPSAMKASSSPVQL